MNQSIGANSFEKSLLEKCTEGWQQESANELWKGSFSSVCSQTSGQNTNQVYENLLRICEEIDTSLPDIKSIVNKEPESQINEYKATLEDELLEDVLAHNVAFEDIGTSLEDIEIYEDILNASAMMDNDDCIYNQNFDIMKTNKFLQSDTFSDFLTLPIPEPMQRTQTRTMAQHGTNTASIFDRAPIFADDEIDQYMASKNFDFNSHDHFATLDSKPTLRDADTEDPVQFWNKLNCGKLPDLGFLQPTPSISERDTSDKSKKSTKSVLAIFDFTLPSLSSTASSCALSSPEQKDIELEPTVSKTLPTQTSSCNVTKHNSQPGLPVLGAEAKIDPGTMNKSAKKKKRSRRNRKKTLKVPKQDLILSSPSSSEYSLATISDIKPAKKRKLNPAPVHQKSTSVEQPKHSFDVKPPTKNKRKPKSSPEPPCDPTSRTLNASAIYVEQQLGVISGQKPHKKQPKAESPSIDKCQKHIPKQATPHLSENLSKRKRNKKRDSKTNITPSNSNSTPKLNLTKGASSQDENRTKNSSSSAASMPSALCLPSLTKKYENNGNRKPSQGPAPGAKPVRTKRKPKARR